MKKYDVVIVGFGPTGGTLANLLALQGFSILVLEKEKSFYPLPRAVHFDDEIMRVFQTIGITDKFLKHTIINKGTKFVDKKNRVILDWPRPREITDNGWYPSYRFNQPDLERELRKKLNFCKKVEIKQSSNVKKIINKKNQVDIKFEDINSKKMISDGIKNCKKLMYEAGAKNVISFGNGFNDVPMISWSGKGIALKESVPEVLKVADDITETVEYDGVARYLESMIENGLIGNDSI